MLWKFVLIGIGFACGDVLMKTWANHNYTWHLPFVGALLIYAVSLTFYGLQLRTTNFSVAILLPIVINVLIVLGLTMFYYHEPLSTKQWFGALFGTLAVILLNF